MIQRHPTWSQFSRLDDKPVLDVSEAQGVLAGACYAYRVRYEQWPTFVGHSGIETVTGLVVDAWNQDVAETISLNAAAFVSLTVLVIVSAEPVDISKLLNSLPNLQCLVLEDYVQCRATELVRHHCLMSLAIRSGWSASVISLLSLPSLQRLEIGPGVRNKEKPTVEALRIALSNDVLPKLRHLGLYNLNSTQALLPELVDTRLSSLSLHGCLTPTLKILATCGLADQLQQLELTFRTHPVDLAAWVFSVPYAQLTSLTLSNAFYEKNGVAMPAYTLLDQLVTPERLTVAFPYSTITDDDVEGILRIAAKIKLAALDLSSNDIYEPIDAAQLARLSFPVIVRDV